MDHRVTYSKGNTYSLGSSSEALFQVSECLGKEISVEIRYRAFSYSLDPEDVWSKGNFINSGKLCEKARFTIGKETAKRLALALLKATYFEKYVEYDEFLVRSGDVLSKSADDEYIRTFHDYTEEVN
jgi:hypothetical protein